MSLDPDPMLELLEIVLLGVSCACASSLLCAPTLSAFLFPVLSTCSPAFKDTVVPSGGGALPGSAQGSSLMSS